jgi:hypothetical protein
LFLIISLEVAEHIPEKYEAVYLDNIFRHAKEGIILSWAVPGQIGLSHIACIGDAVNITFSPFHIILTIKNGCKCKTKIIESFTKIRTIIYQCVIRFVIRSEKMR